jgi:hypothetical protein
VIVGSYPEQGRVLNVKAAAGLAGWAVKAVIQLHP